MIQIEMVEDMWKRIDNYVEEHHMIEAGDHIILGLSGGADSILLARYLLHLREEKEISIDAVHVNHLLRGAESLRDEGFVHSFCQEWKIPLTIYRKEVEAYASSKKCSIEEAGREIRLTCFYETIQTINASKQEKTIEENPSTVKIALAHHKDDLAETMLFRMARGTGIEGLAGILPFHEGKIRPLLCVDKEEILWMLSELRQDYVEDSTNAEEVYSRNYIRHQLIPGMRNVNPRAIDHMGQLAFMIQEQTQYMGRMMDRLFEENVEKTDHGMECSCQFLQECDPYEQKEMIRRMLFLAAGRKKDIGTVHVEAVQSLITKPVGKQRNLPYHLLAIRKEDRIYIGKKVYEAENPTEAEIIPLPIPFDQMGENAFFSLPISEEETLLFELYSSDKVCLTKNDCVKYFDYDKIKGKLMLRTRQSGDYFIMDHNGSRKTIKKFFIDEKIAASKRNHIYLLAEGSHILWILGYRISETYKVSEQSKNILKVTYSRKELCGGNYGRQD